MVRDCGGATSLASTGGNARLDAGAAGEAMIKRTIEKLFPLPLLRVLPCAGRRTDKRRRSLQPCERNLRAAPRPGYGAAAELCQIYACPRQIGPW